MVLINSNAFEDIVFCTSLFLCFTLAKNYKSIEACEKRREFSAGLGLFVTCLLCGSSLYHAIFIVWGNVILIKCGDKKYVHLLSLSYTWLYLFYLYNNVILTPYVAWLFQTVALRMVGVAYEIAIFHEQGELPEKGLEWDYIEEDLEKSSNKALKHVKSMPDHCYGLKNSPLAIDIITYAFCFIGLHKGPYYNWKVFYKNVYDSHTIELKDNREITISNFQKAFASGLAFAVIYSIFPTTIYHKEDFYTNYSCVGRYFMGLPHLILFFLQHYTIIVLCSCVFTESNFGYYSYSSMDIYREYDNSLESDSVTKCLENHMLLLNPMMSETICYYDMPAGYWFTAYPYNHTLKISKHFRSAFTFFLWAIWRGASLTEFLLAITTWVYVHLELIYNDLIEFGTTSVSESALWDVSFSIMRLLYLIYIAPCLVVYDPRVVFQFYCSIYWVYHIVIIGLTFTTVLIKSNKTDMYFST